MSDRHKTVQGTLMIKSELTIKQLGESSQYKRRADLQSQARMISKWPQRLISKVRKMKGSPDKLQDIRAAITLHGIGPMVPAQMWTTFTSKPSPDAPRPLSKDRNDLIKRAALKNAAERVK